MATGVSISKRTVVKSVRNLRQKVHFFKWKMWKYEEASDAFFLDGNTTMVEMCDKNFMAYRSAFMNATATLERVERRLASM